MTDHESIILICAFRYALGRQTYVTGCVQEEIKRKWAVMAKCDRSLIKRDINEAMQRPLGLWNPQIDAVGWLAILELED